MPVVTLSYNNTVMKDATLAQSSPDTSFPSDVYLYVGKSAGANGIQRSLLKFDLGLIPNDAIINSASLRLYQDSSGTTPGTVTIHSVTSDWLDTTVTWNTTPNFDPTVYGTFNGIANAKGAIAVDISGLIQKFVNGDIPNRGLLMKVTDETATNAMLFSSVESTTGANRPQLTIDYTIPTTGKKQVEYVGSGTTASNNGSVKFALPVGVQDGDLLVAQFDSYTTIGGLPSGWTLAQDVLFSSYHWVVAYKIKTPSDGATTFSNGGTNSIAGRIHAFRNVKGVLKSSASNNSGSLFNPPAETTTVDKTLFAIFNSSNNSTMTWTPPKSYTEIPDTVSANPFQSMYKYMHLSRSQTTNEMQAVASTTGNGQSILLVLEPITNNPPTDPSGVNKDKSAYTVGDTITVSFTGSTDVDGDAITYELDVYDGVSAWTTIATGKTASPITATIPSMVDTTSAKVRVRALDARGASSNGGESTTFTVAQRDGQILAPVNVVSSAYLVSRMAPPVRLSNGWLVGAVYDTANTQTKFYKSSDNGRTWSQLTFITLNASAGFSLVNKGTHVFFLCAATTSTTNSLLRFDATAVTNTDQTANKVVVDSAQTAFGAQSLAITPDGTKLWWTASTKNPTYANSYNIRAGSVQINADSTLGTPSAVSQLSVENTTGQDSTNPSFVMRGDGNPSIVYQLVVGSSNKYIVCDNYNGSAWSGRKVVFDGGTYAQSSPMAIRTPNGKLHVVWHGTDSTDTTNAYIRYSNSTNGTTWLATPKKLVKGTNANITSDKNGKLFITYEDGGYIKRIESTDEFTTWTAPVTVAVGTVPASLYDPTFQFEFTIPPTFFQGSSSVKYYGSFDTNKKPTVTLNTPDNQTLIEKATLVISGSATDPDNGNVVTAKYKINNGSARALQSGVSDGSTPISFAKTLTYSGKRMLEGSTDVTGYDLAENMDHILTVWSEDDKGGKSEEVSVRFRVVWNRPPTISGSDADLGTILTPPSIQYSAVDPEGNTFTFTEYLNGQEIRSFAGTANQNYTVQIDHDAWIRLDLGVQHQIKIKAADSGGVSSERVYTFTRTETHIEFLLNFDSPEVQGHFILDGMPERVLVTLERYIPEGAEIESVKVCNNALDTTPTWEDATIAVKANRGYLFTNTTKTAANWAINIWVIIAKGTATERVRLNGYGGAFD